MIGYQKIKTLLARKLALESGHYLVPITKPLQWAEQAGGCEGNAMRSEARGSAYTAGFWSGQGVALLRVGSEIERYNAKADRIDEGDSVKGLVGTENPDGE